MARASTFKQIPNIPNKNGDATISAIIDVLDPMKEILEVYQGNKGNSLGLDRVVRFQDIAILDPTTFSGSRASYARIVRVSGNVVRSGKVESTDSSTYFDLDNDKIVFNGKINYASKMPGIFLGKDDDNTYKFNIGYDDKGSVKFDGTNTYLGLWSITPNGIGDNLTENSSKIFLDKTNTAIRVGPTSGNYVTVDGENVKVASSNYVSGVAGAGFHLDSDLLEVGNIAARGIIRTAVFQKDVVSAVGGHVMVRPSDVLGEDMLATDAGGIGSLLLEDEVGFLLEDGGAALGETGTYYQLDIEGNETFAVGDFLRIKDGLDDEWLEVIDITGAPEKYLVERDKAGDYTADENPTWTKGATVVNYGASGDGGVFMTASESNAPYLSIFTHAGSPWDTITTHLRLGNLNGFLGYSDDLYGIAVGSTNKYLKYDPTNDLRIQGNITVTGDNGFVKIYDAVPTERVRLGNLNGFLGYSSDLYGIAIGEANKSLTYDPTNGLVITGPGITAGALQSADWAAALGVKLDLTNKYLKMGGSDVDAAGAAAGVFLGLDTLYKVYIGDGSINYLKFDGVNLTLSGGINLGTTGYVRTEGKTTYADNDAGLWLGYDTDAYKLYIGTATSYIKWDGTLLSVTGTGVLSSADWAAAAGVSLNMTDKYLKMGGSNVTAAGAAAGIFLGLDTSYKFYCGDGSNEFLKYDGTNFSLSTAKAGGIAILSGGGMTISQGGSLTMTGGSTGNPSLIKFDDNDVPGAIRFYNHDDATEYHQLSALNANRQFCVGPVGFDNETYTAQLGYGTMGYTDIFFVFNKDDDTPANNKVAIWLETGGSASEYYGFYETALLPKAASGLDCGGASNRWGVGYFTSVDSLADFYHLDDKDDLAELHKIKGSGKYDPIAGLELIDDNTLPEWMLSKAKKDEWGPSRIIGPDGYRKDVVKELVNKKGDILYSPEGKPFLSNTLLISFLMGCIRQLDNKIEAMRN